MSGVAVKNQQTENKASSEVQNTTLLELLSNISNFCYDSEQYFHSHALHEVGQLVDTASVFHHCLLHAALDQAHRYDSNHLEVISQSFSHTAC